MMTVHQPTLPAMELADNSTSIVEAPESVKERAQHDENKTLEKAVLDADCALTFPAIDILDAAIEPPFTIQ